MVRLKCKTCRWFWNRQDHESYETDAFCCYEPGYGSEIKVDRPACHEYEAADQGFGYSVVVDDYLVTPESNKKISMIKWWKERNDLGLKEAKDWVESLPHIAGSGLTMVQAEALKREAEQAGGICHIV